MLILVAAFSARLKHHCRRWDILTAFPRLVVIGVPPVVAMRPLLCGFPVSRGRALGSATSWHSSTKPKLVRLVAITLRAGLSIAVAAEFVERGVFLSLCRFCFFDTRWRRFVLACLPSMR